MSKIIKVSLKGGLGNQLFQLAFAVALSKKLGAKRIILSSRNLNSYGTPRDFELSSWLNNDIYHEVGGLYKFAAKIVESLFSGVVSVCGVTYVSGYFQDKKEISRYVSQGDYIKAIEMLRSAFYFDRNDSILAGREILHLRGTDFAQREKLLKHVDSLVMDFPINSNTLLVSDDSDLVSIMQNRYENLEYSFLFGMSSLEMLRAFACSKGIFSNGSTLSWWAAVLGVLPIVTKRENLEDLSSWIKRE